MPARGVEPNLEGGESPHTPSRGGTLTDLLVRRVFLCGDEDSDLLVDSLGHLGALIELSSLRSTRGSKTSPDSQLGEKSAKASSFIVPDDSSDTFDDTPATSAISVIISSATSSSLFVIIILALSALVACGPFIVVGLALAAAP